MRDHAGWLKRIRPGLVSGVSAVALMYAADASAAMLSGSRTTSFANDSVSGLLTQEIVEPNTTSLRLETDYTYDAFGNKTAATISGAGIATRTGSTTFDSRGQFPAVTTNALNQRESWQYDPRYGLPTSHTDLNGLVTTWTYDGFGRKTQETRPDGTSTKLAYLYCSGVNGGSFSCPTNGAYVVQSTPYGAGGAQNGPQNTVTYDQLGREIARDTQGWDGGGAAPIIRVSTFYDALGRVSRVSRPYYTANGGTPCASGGAPCTTLAYDALGRVVTRTEANGGQTQYGFNGQSTTVTDALGHTTSITKNDQGLVRLVQDAYGGSRSLYYDPFDNMVRSTDQSSNSWTATYDTRGRRTGETDPDRGSWSFAYDVLDEETSQTDAKGQITTFSYDVLRRLIQRQEPDLTSTWTYDTASMGIGKLATATTNLGNQRALTYDSLSRPSQVALTIDGTTYNIGGSYDANGRVSSSTYPSGFAVRYSYTTLGYLQKMSDASSGASLWTVNSMEADLQIVSETAGNGVSTTTTFDVNTGLLQAVGATNGGGTAIQNLTYTRDLLGQPTVRSDSLSGLSESFRYDNLNRLTQAAVTGLTATTYAYDAVGNLTGKSDVGAYTYPASGSPLPHAVQSISGTLNTNFGYDANGNMTSGAGRTFTYTSFNKASQIIQGAGNLQFTHDSEHERIKQIGSAGTTYYLNALGLNVERFVGSPTVQWNEYLVAGGNVIGVRFNRADGTVLKRYFHKDALGSIVALSDDSGSLVESDSYDAWGKRRYPNGQSDPTGSLTSQTTRGFTGQEELSAVALINLNARLYDPYVARFTSADSIVNLAYSTQGWNRYTYAGNGPLFYTDPNGYCFLGCFWKPVEHFFEKSALARGVLAVAAAATLQYYALPAFEAEAGLSVATTTASAAQVAAVQYGAVNAALAGAAAGGIQGGTLKSAIVGSLTASAFYGVGELTTYASKAYPGYSAAIYVGNVAGHAAIGCASAAAMGASCGSGALAAGLSGAAGPIYSRMDLVEGVAASSVLGGIGSVITGGKFANGAVTGAFGYLFNDAAHPNNNLSGTSFDQSGWQMVGEVMDDPLTFTAGSRIGIQASSVAFPPMNVFVYDVNALPLDQNGSPIYSVPNEFNTPSEYSSGFTGTGVSRSFVFTAVPPGNIPVSGYRWTVTIPPQQDFALPNHASGVERNGIPAQYNSLRVYVPR